MTDSGPTIRLRPLREDEYEAFVAASKAGYAQGIEEQAGFSAEYARHRAEEDFFTVLPAGLETPGHAIFVVEAEGEPVGRLWIAEREMGARQVLYIYDIEIDPAFRGRGLGRAAMLLAEEQARARGISRIALNVFGGNDAARELYRSLGYLESSVQMAKDLD
ncbi:MAG: GNAT family N-acetyltransferase [Chloroflexota bacterium]